MTETIRHKGDENHVQAMAYTNPADVLSDTKYDGSEDSILFILAPDGTHTIPKRDVDSMVEVYPYPASGRISPMSTLACVLQARVRSKGHPL
jgi:hypothetical protein